MFVERMEVLEYRKKIGVKISTFLDSTNTETPKNWILARRVCVCLCKKVVSGYLTNKLTDLNENFSVRGYWLRIENLPQPVQDVHDIYTTVLRACLPGLRQMLPTSTARWRFSEVEPRAAARTFDFVLIFRA